MTLPLVTAGLWLAVTPLSAQTRRDSVVSLRDVEVNGSAQRNLNGMQMGSKTIAGEDIVRLPTFFGEPDVVRALQMQPGVAQGMEGFTGLYVHGGEGDQNLFLYEGLPLYNVGHLAGVFSAFNVATVSHVDFYKAAFPAQYGGRVSSIVDIRMREPNFQRYTGRFSLGLLSANAYLSGPIVREKLAFAVGVRRSMVDVLSLPVLAGMNHAKKKDGEKIIADYHFTDLNVRLDYKPTASLTASVIGYYGHDYLRIGQREFDMEDFQMVLDMYGNPIEKPEEEKLRFYDENVNRLSWGNWGVLARAQQRWATGTLSLSAYYASYFSDYRQGREYQTDLRQPSTYGYNRERARNNIDDYGVTAAYMQTLGSRDVLRAGAGYVRHDYLPEGITRDWIDEGQSLHDDNGTQHVHADEAYAYVDNTYDLTSWLAVGTGLRATLYAIEGKTYTGVEPRASMKVRLSRNMSLKASYSRMTQMAQQVSSNNITLPTDMWQPVSARHRPIVSDQVALGLYGNLPWQTYFSVEGWYKDLRHVLEYRDGVSMLNPRLPWTDKVTAGRGWAYGADVTATKYAGPFTGTVSYALMWNWRRFDQLNGGQKFPSKFDTRHKVNVNLSYKPSQKVEWNVAWTYMSGNRQTFSTYNYELTTELYPDAPGVMSPSGLDGGLDYDVPRNNFRLPAYHRLDVGLTLTRPLRHGATGAWSFGLYNAYWRMNAITVKKHEEIYSTTNGRATWLKRSFKTLSLLPILPSVTYTYSF